MKLFVTVSCVPVNDLMLGSTPTAGVSLVIKSCLTLATPWTVARQTPLSMGLSRQEYWSGLLFPSPGDLPDPGIKPRSPALQVDSLATEPPGKPSLTLAKTLAKYEPQKASATSRAAVQAQTLHSSTGRQEGLGIPVCYEGNRTDATREAEEEGAHRRFGLFLAQPASSGPGSSLNLTHRHFLLKGGGGEELS